MKDRYFGSKLSLLILTILFVAFSNPVSASSASTLDVSIMEYEPFPAQIGEYVDVWVKVENVGYGKADAVSIQIEPEYPFSMDSKSNAVKNIGILAPQSAAVHKFRLFVDSGANKGTGSIDIRYQTDKGSAWFEESFNIKVGSDTFDSKGTLQLEEVRIDPEVLMPGDKGTVSFTFKNGASHNTINLDGKDYDTNSRIQSATLKTPVGFEVESDTYNGKGVIGPGDSVTITYHIEVDEAAADGLYNMDLAIVGSSHAYNSNWRVPVKVDSADVKVIPSKPMVIMNGEGTLEFDVANMHPNTLSSVSIRPEADGIEFSPAEYFIGSMDSDELFTIEFDARMVSENGSGSRDLKLTALYRNGINFHESEFGTLELETVDETSNGNTGVVVGGTMFAAMAIGGVFVYRRRFHK